MSTAGAIIVTLIILKMFTAGNKAIFNNLNQTLQWFVPALQAAREFNVPVAIVLGIIDQESAGDPDAKGSAGEIGLMQLKQIAVDDLIDFGFDVDSVPSTDPIENIRQGAAFYWVQLQRAKNEFDALRAYNQGFAGSQKNPKIGAGYAKDVTAKATVIANELEI